MITDYPQPLIPGHRGPKNSIKKHVEETCYDMALKRIEDVYDRFDHVSVSFSGGKDSTAILNLCLAVAKKKDKMPVNAVFWDEECLPPETVEYMLRVADNPEISLRWFCMPIEHRNACSQHQPYWYPWAPEERALWVRDLPDHPSVITDFPGFQRKGIPFQNQYVFPRSMGSVCAVLGIRTDESISRYRSVCLGKRGFLNFYNDDLYAKHIQKASPIYDWHTDDVWLAPHMLGWDYNRSYDVMNAAGVKYVDQRVAPPFGEQPARNLWMYATCWPELWDKMICRVPGASTAARSYRTELFGVGKDDDRENASGKSYQQLCMEGLKKLDEKARAEVSLCLKQFLLDHRRYTTDPLTDDIPHPKSGYCWRIFLKVVQVGGNKFNRQFQRFHKFAMEYRYKIAQGGKEKPKGKVHRS